SITTLPSLASCSMIRHPPRTSLFPYTTLFRSQSADATVVHRAPRDPRATLLPAVATRAAEPGVPRARSAKEPSHGSGAAIRGGARRTGHWLSGPAGSRGHTSAEAEAREQLAGAREPARCQKVKPATRPAGSHRVDRFPSAHEPPGRFETKENRVQRAGCNTAALLHVRTGLLVGRTLEKRFQHPKRLQGHSHVTIPLSHTRKST